MSEFRVEVTVEEVQYLCDDCVVEMKPTGVMLSSNPPWFPHQCPSCGKHEDLKRKYPYRVFIPKRGPRRKGKCPKCGNKTYDQVTKKCSNLTCPLPF